MDLTELKVTIARDGVEVEVDIDLDPNHLTLRESVRLERELGEDRATALFSGGEVVISPSVIQVMIWAKLASKFPDIGLDDFDLDLGVLSEQLTDEADSAPALSSADVETALFVEDVPLRAVGGEKKA